MAVPIDYAYRSPKKIFGPKPWCMVRHCNHKATRNLVYKKGKKAVRVCKYHQTDWVARQFAKKDIPALYGFKGGYVVIGSVTKKGDRRRMREMYEQQKQEALEELRAKPRKKKH